MKIYLIDILVMKILKFNNSCIVCLHITKHFSAPLIHQGFYNWIKFTTKAMVWEISTRQNKQNIIVNDRFNFITSVINTMTKLWFYDHVSNCICNCLC